MRAQGARFDRRMRAQILTCGRTSAQYLEAFEQLMGHATHLHNFVGPSVPTFFNRRVTPATAAMITSTSIIVLFQKRYISILGYESPLWDLAYYFPAMAQGQEAMIHELAVKK